VDENLQPKEVYKTLDHLINKEWETRISELKSNKNGDISFRGFKGNYSVKVLKNGKVIKETQLNYSNLSNNLSTDL
jgi:hypothetical protein